jgi:drug/metabolite transporter (DMT)-like permease
MTAGIFLLSAVIIWGWTFVATKISLNYLSPLSVMGLRLFIGLPVMYAIILARGIKFDFRGHRKALFLGALIITVHFIIQVIGIKYTSATNTGWLIAAIPLITAVLARLILKERIGRNVILGIVIATVGILLLISRGKLLNFGRLSSIGDWLVLGSAHTWALYTITTRDLVRTCNPLTVTFTMLLAPAMVAVMAMPFVADWHAIAHLPLEAVLSLLFLGILGTAIAHWFWQEGVSSLGAAKAGIYLYLEPLATTALAIPYLREPFGIYTAFGGALVLSRVALAQRKVRLKLI